MAFFDFLIPKSLTDDIRSINQNIKKLMSAIADFAAKQNAHNDAIDTAVSGITADVQELKTLIETLQNSAGQITPEDQSTLDALEARSAAVADKLAALDALTPPAAPAPEAPATEPA